MNRHRTTKGTKPERREGVHVRPLGSSLRDRRGGKWVALGFGALILVVLFLVFDVGAVLSGALEFI
ncbi:MAG: hypothetical protein AB7O66_14615, partial [Limisphaerales bacterium]